MSTPVIEVRDLSKKYRIGGVKEIGYRTLRDSIASLWQRGAKPSVPGAPESIWALREVSFDLGAGEALGVIGRNGAGKSTLLKILSRITEPTDGRAVLRGKVASMLEVGTGFHPELTGRENIFLNGSILGMTRADIAKRFDEIVAFAEVETFLDTPVKRYSSGMYVRLAFAVAAHLEPDILIVDEVLSVGDASFQKKCLGRMDQVGREGRTVIFVSHNLTTVTRLCTRALLLDHGRLVMDAPAHEVARFYLRSDLGTSAVRRWTPENAPGTEVVRLREVRILQDNVPADRVDIRRPVFFEMTFDVAKGGSELVPSFELYSADGTPVFVSFDHDPAWLRKPREPGRYTSSMKIPGNFLAEGGHLVTAAISTLGLVYHAHVGEKEVVAFDVIDPFEGDSARLDYGGDMHGVVRPVMEWSNLRLAEDAGSGQAPRGA